MDSRFEEFLRPLKETQFSLCDYVDFPKVTANVRAVPVKLNTLNYLIGKSDIEAAVNDVWQLCPEAFSVLSLLVAVRSNDHKKFIDSTGNTRLIADCFTSPAGVMEYLNNTGLAELLREKV